MNAAPLVQVSNLEKSFLLTGGIGAKASPGRVRALIDVSVSVTRGEVLGIVGESGSGKTTLGRLILQMARPDRGSVIFDGREIAGLSRAKMRRYRRRMQMIFQDPFSSLNPRMSVKDIIGEPMIIHGVGSNEADRQRRVAALLDLVGLPASASQRYPHEFSGGQRQRIGIARAMALQPDFIVADEPVSALDVSIQAQIINLLSDLKDRLGLTMMFIAHDLAVVRRIADRVAVMYLGRVVELAPSDALFARPRHPYTEALLSAVPTVKARSAGDRIILSGDLPSPLNPPTGCPFRTRCPYALPACADQPPVLTEVAAGHFKACIRDDIL